MDARHEEIDVLLSAYRDGELSGAEKEEVEEALRSDPALQARLADHEALSAFLLDSLDQRMDAVDFSRFADSVMAKIEAPAAAKPKKAPLWARFQVAITEILEYRRWQFVSAAAAAVLLLVAGPLLWEQTHPQEMGPLLAGGPGLVSVTSVTTSGDTDAMIFQTKSGTTVIYVQEQQE